MKRPDPAIPVKRQAAAGNYEKSYHVRLYHEHRTIELKLPQDLLGRLAIEAHFENLNFSDLISKLLTSALATSIDPAL